VTVSAEDSASESPRYRSRILRWRGGRILLQLRLAVSFLTIVPIAIESANDSDVAASMAWFPLVGLAMGLTFALEDRALAVLFGHAVRSAIVVLSMVVLSGAIHLDGLADTADALGAGRDHVRALEILRDSRIGTFGAIALFFALGLKVLSLAGMSGKPRLAALILAPTLSRWALVAVSYKLEYLRAAGAGSAMLGRGSDRNLAIASAITLIATIPFISPKVIGTCGIAVIATLAMRYFYRRWLRGITGDLIGACGELVEVIAMVVIAS
jgi:adenosylcobinamide-GDP ribazoletransferase